MTKQQTRRWWITDEVHAPQRFAPPTPEAESATVQALAPAERDLWEELDAEARRRSACALEQGETDVLDITISGEQWARRCTRRGRLSAIFASTAAVAFAALIILFDKDFPPIMPVVMPVLVVTQALILARLYARWTGPALRLTTQGIAVRLPLSPDLLLHWDDVADIRRNRKGRGPGIEIHVRDVDAAVAHNPEARRSAVRRTLNSERPVQFDNGFRYGPATISIPEELLGEPADRALARMTIFRAAISNRT
jgi:hypothetical protein